MRLIAEERSDSTSEFIIQRIPSNKRAAIAHTLQRKSSIRKCRKYLPSPANTIWFIIFPE